MKEELYKTFSPDQNNLLVIDDQLPDGAKSEQLEKYFVQCSHRRNLTLVFIAQNIFEKGQAMRTSNLNSHYLVMYKNPETTVRRHFLEGKWIQVNGATSLRR